MSVTYPYVVAERGEWIESISVELSSSNVSILEWMQNLESDDVIEGRSLSIDNPTAFLKELGVKSEVGFETTLQGKLDKGLLTIDHFHAFCERHRLNYSLTGRTLITELREYNKEKREHQAQEFAQGKELYEEGRGLLYGNESSSSDVSQGIQSLVRSAKFGYKYAYGELAMYFTRRGHFDEAEKMAKEGAKQSEPRSMYFLALSYERKADFPAISPETKANYYQKATKLCLWAAEIGYIPAMRRVNKYIHEGILTPDTKLYLELLVLTARYNTRCRPRHQQKQK